MEPVRDVTGVILAGGNSSRYGKNKAFVEVNGTPLIERVIGVMASVFDEVILMTNTPDEYVHLGLPMYADLIKGLGPVGGIYTALTVIRNAAGFFVACDMPALNAGLIRYMAAVRGAFDVVVPKISWRIEPLHAIYGRRCLPEVKRLIDARQYQIFHFFPKVSVRHVTEEEIRRYDPDLSSFFNINRPEDLRSGKRGPRPGVRAE